MCFGDLILWVVPAPPLSHIPTDIATSARCTGVAAHRVALLNRRTSHLRNGEQQRVERDRWPAAVVVEATSTPAPCRTRATRGPRYARATRKQPAAHRFHGFVAHLPRVLVECSPARAWRKAESAQHACLSRARGARRRQRGAIGWQLRHDARACGVVSGGGQRCRRHAMAMDGRLHEVAPSAPACRAYRARRARSL